MFKGIKCTDKHVKISGNGVSYIDGSYDFHFVFIFIDALLNVILFCIGVKLMSGYFKWSPIII